MTRFWSLFVLSLFVAVPPANSGETDTESLRSEIRALKQAYEGRIAALEEEVKGLRVGAPVRKSADARIDESLKAKGVVGQGERLFDVSRPPVQAGNKVSVGGYMEFTYIDRGDKVQEFDQLRTVAQLGAQIHERIKLYIEMEFEHGAVVEGGEETGGEIELEQAWLDYTINKALVFRVGTILAPVGRYNLYHEGFVNNLVDRPLLNRRIVPTTWSEEGLGFYGTVVDTNSLGMSYEAYVFNPGRVAEVSSGGGFRGIRNEGQTPIYDGQKAAAARVAFEPARGAKWLADHMELGLSGYVSGFNGFKGETDAGDVNFNGGESHILAVDFTYEKSIFGIKGEAARAHADRGFNDTGRHQDAWGCYAEGYVKFWPKFLNSSPFGKDFKDPKLVFAVRYEQVDLNEDTLDQRDLNRVTFGISYRPVPRTVFKFDYQVDHSPSSRAGTALGESGKGKNTDAFLFGVSTGF